MALNISSGTPIIARNLLEQGREERARDIYLHGRLKKGQGAYYRYLKDYDLDPLGIEFGPENVHVLADHHGIEIDDIIGTEENEILLQTCLDHTCQLTASKDTAVYFLIAG